MNIIYLGRDSFKQDVVNYETEFLDGTHTEALYLAEFLVKHCETRIYCSVKNGYSNDCGIQFLPYSNFYQDIDSIKIDNIFIMCNLSSDELLSINANRIYLLLENEWFCSGVTEENINHIYKILLYMQHPFYKNLPRKLIICHPIFHIQLLLSYYLLILQLHIYLLHFFLPNLQTFP